MQKTLIAFALCLAAASSFASTALDAQHAEWRPMTPPTPYSFGPITQKCCTVDGHCYACYQH